MPDGPQGKENFEYEKKQPRHKFKSTGSEEELGDMHLSTENYSVALEYYDKALQRNQTSRGDSTGLLRIYRKISDCYRKKGLLNEAMSFLDKASSYCDEDDSIGKGTIACRRGIILYERGDIKRALREACAAYRTLRTSNEHREVANTQLLMANSYSRMGNSEEAEQYYLDALSSYRRTGDLVGESYVLNNLALFQKNACRWGRALHFLGRAAEICNEVGLTQHKVRVTLNMGIVQLKKRDFAGAENSFVSARDMARRIGDDLKYTRSTLMLGVKETVTGNLLSAEKHLLEAKVIAERRNYRREIALADEFLGDFMFSKDDLEGAMENYSSALEMAVKINPEGDIVAEVQRRIMQVHLARKKADMVLELAKKAMRTCRKSGEMHEIGFIERMVGQAFAILKKDVEAEKYINMSIGTFLSVNNPYDAHRSGMILCECLLKKNDRRSAVMAKKLASETLSFLERAEEFSDCASCHFLLSRIEEFLSNRDECLLHIYEAERLSEELRDRNLTRRLRRMRKRVEVAAAGAVRVHAAGNRLSSEFSEIFVHDSQMRTYLDYILNDLMRRLTAGHGFVVLTDGNGGEPLILARRGITEEKTIKISEWYFGREHPELADKFLVSDAANDRRLKEISGELPNRSAPVYFHPLLKDGVISGLLFFQSQEETGAPKVGSILEVVTTYANFIGFLVNGSKNTVAGIEKKSDNQGDVFSGMITRNERMLRIIDLIARVAKSDSTVLLMGETGTGKGIAAQAIHDFSKRRNGKFIHVNCAALPETILESELFGHVRGAFTGAITDKKGLLAEADGGTVFLDEIGKAPLPIQGKLLQFLDSKKVRPVGGNEMFEVNVRLVFASKADLLMLCREGRMLEDFYYRINDFPITIPPLRERADDIQLLASHYLSIYCREMDKKIVGFSDEAIEFLKGCSWPGNVRELGKIIKRAVILAEENGVITPERLVFDFTEPASIEVEDPESLPEMVKELEKRVITDALEMNSWNRKSTAAALGISYPTLLKKIRDFKIEKVD